MVASYSQLFFKKRVISFAAPCVCAVVLCCSCFLVWKNL
ncbi:hypothetical protein GYH30_006298 [Glycine max]|nr:hypothetical protein GYH30_006298 [Glycine max]